MLILDLIPAKRILKKVVKTQENWCFKDHFKNL